MAVYRLNPRDRSRDHRAISPGGVRRHAGTSQHVAHRGLDGFLYGSTLARHGAGLRREPDHPRRPRDGCDSPRLSPSRCPSTATRTFSRAGTTPTATCTACATSRPARTSSVSIRQSNDRHRRRPDVVGVSGPARGRGLPVYGATARSVIVGRHPAGDDRTRPICGVTQPDRGTSRAVAAGAELLRATSMSADPAAARPDGSCTCRILARSNGGVCASTRPAGTSTAGLFGQRGLTASLHAPR